MEKSNDEKYHSLVNKQRAYFETGVTFPYVFRKEQLLKLKKLIKAQESSILNALYADLGKPKFEGYVSEVGFIYEEINTVLKDLKKWMKPNSKGSGLLNFPSKSYVLSEPKGVTLIIGPWNYPFQLLLAPMVASMAAGNTCIVKPPEQTPAISNLLEKIIKDNFNENYIAVRQGEGQVIVPGLMKNNRFDHVFFTGSVPVGRKIAEMAAPNLTPFTLELGGKSPCVVDKSANLKVSAKRIAFGKWLNAGQTCVAPDYLLVHESIQIEFQDLLKAIITEFYGENPLKSEYYGSIINVDRFETLEKFLKEGITIFGGKYDKESLRMEPTLITNLSESDALLQEEIFGPILPILTFESSEEAIQIIKKHPNPLALYVFAEDKEVQEIFTRKLSFGGGMINNTVIHLTNADLPFGGVGTSGMGNYHGEFGFKTFSHQKAVMKTGTWFDLKLKYPPYDDFVYKIIKRVME